MNAKRLLKLAEFLETKVPRKEFNMGYWSLGKKPGCGTAACAVGWASTIPSFKRAGLTLIPEVFGREFYPKYGINKGYYAVKSFFGISTCEEVEHLFKGGRYPSLNPTPKQVAKRIRQFVKTQDAKV